MNENQKSIQYLRRVTTITPAQLSKTQNSKRQKQEQININTLYPSSQALKDWQEELNNKEESTIQRYEQYFSEFLNYINKNPDELIVQRQQDLLSPDIKTQRTIERQFLAFLKQKKEGFLMI